MMLRSMKFGLVYLLAMIIALGMGQLVRAGISDTLDLPDLEVCWEHDKDEREFIYIGPLNGETIYFSINKSELKDKLFALDLKTNAKKVKLFNDSGEIELRPAREKCSIIFDNREKSTIEVNGKDGSKYRGALIRIMRDSGEKIQVVCEKAKYLNIGYRDKVEFSATINSIKTNLISSRTGQKEAEEAARLVDDRAVSHLKRKVERSIVEIDVLDKVGKPLRTVTGFAVRGDYLVTSFKGIEGAASAVARHRERSYSLELVRVEQQYDVAVMMVKEDKAKKTGDDEEKGLRAQLIKNTFEWLRMSDDEPSVGDALWLAGYAQGDELMMIKGLCEGIEVNPEWQYGRVIRTSSVVNEGNIGGPLVNRLGVCLGIATRNYEKNAEGYYAISIEHVKAVLKKCDKKKPETFKVIPTIYKTSDGGRLPVLKIKEDVPAKQLLRLAMNFKQGIICGACNGEGVLTKRKVVANEPRIIEQQTTSSRSSNRRRTSYDREREERLRQQAKKKQDEKKIVLAEIDCKTCDGNGLRSNPVMLRNMDIATMKIANLNMQTDGVSNLLERFKESVQSTMAEHVNDIRRVIVSDRAHQLDAKVKVNIGKPVFVVGKVKSIQDGSEGHASVRFVTLSYPKVQLALTNPRMVDKDLGGYLVIGGVLAGETKVKGKTYQVLQNGYLISLPDEKEFKSNL
ncbi:trypsin-like peptidase domain-containing protein [Planctomycetota bacterium]|nr:trypsin-like peptidase domain-containing protein [Planctomycetota bacterium]